MLILVLLYPLVKQAEAIDHLTTIVFSEKKGYFVRHGLLVSRNSALPLVLLWWTSEAVFQSQFSDFVDMLLWSCGQRAEWVEDVGKDVMLD